MKSLEIDWQSLHGAFQMTVPEVHCFFCLETGSVEKVPKHTPEAKAYRNDHAKYAMITAIPSHIQYQWVDVFIRSVEDEELRERMRNAVNGKGAFRRFKDILLGQPEDRRRWFEFRDQQVRERIVEWVREHGVEATNTPPWVEDVEVKAQTSQDKLLACVNAWNEANGNALPDHLVQSLTDRIGDEFRLILK